MKIHPVIEPGVQWGSSLHGIKTREDRRFARSQGFIFPASKTIIHRYVREEIEIVDLLYRDIGRILADIQSLRDQVVESGRHRRGRRRRAVSRYIYYRGLDRGAVWTKDGALDHLRGISRQRDRGARVLYRHRPAAVSGMGNAGRVRFGTRVLATHHRGLALRLFGFELAEHAFVHEDEKRKRRVRA